MNNSFIMYKNLSILYSSNNRIDIYFRKLGYTEVYLYGLGEFGQLIKKCLKDTDIIKGVSDKRIKKTETIYDDDLGAVMGYTPSEIPNDDIPVVVAIAENYGDVRKFLEFNGVNVNRIISLNSMLRMLRYLLFERNSINCNETKDDYLIVGANFDNKGSQAMAFVTMNEIRKHCENALIWFCPNFWDDDYKNNKYRMIILEDGYGVDSTVCEIMPRLKCVFDISGYAMSSTPGFGGTDRMIDFMKLAYDYNVPYFLMPQSFGPLNYPEYKMAELGVLLASCKAIFARENKGYNLLTEKFSLDNIEQSYDMVLQSKSFVDENIYINPSQENIDICFDENTVGIVPNTNLHLFISDEEVEEIYRKVIDILIKRGKKVVIIPHSDDSILCDSIYKYYVEEKSVQYVKTNFDCIQFERIISNLDFLIASRFHSIVHAYKVGVPCVVIGWADKYNELSVLVDQVDYLWDIRKKDETIDIENMIDKMIKDNIDNRETIKKNLDKIQDTSCFDKVWDLLRDSIV